MPVEMLINATVCGIHCTVSPNRLHHINWRILLTWLSTQKHGRLAIWVNKLNATTRQQEFPFNRDRNYKDDGDGQPSTRIQF